MTLKAAACGVAVVAALTGGGPRTATAQENDAPRVAPDASPAARARRTAETVRTRARAAYRELRLARAHQDPRAAACVDRKLNELLVAARNARTHAAHLRDAVALRRSDWDRHDRFALGVLDAHSAQLYRDARCCTARRVVSARPSVTVTIDATIPPVDPAHPETPASEIAPIVTRR